jgi:hypothetical protein
MFKNPELFLIFENFFLKNGKGFWAKLQFFVVLPKFDQIFFFKNSKRTWLKKARTNKKWPETLISEHLVAVNPCGPQAKKSEFHVSTVKSRNNKIWIFLLEGFNLAHSSSLIHIWNFWDSFLGHQVLANVQFWPILRPI